MLTATISEPDMWMPRLSAIARHREEILSVAVFGVWLWQSPFLAQQFVSPQTWSASGLYSGIFSWASIQAGFLFAVYTFIVPRSEPFVRAIAATKAFADFKRYMLVTVYLTFAVSIAALGLMVVNPSPPVNGFPAGMLAAWIAVTVYSFLRFLKVIRTFRMLDR